MSDHGMVKIHVDLPHHWAAGGESLWASPLGGDRYRVENVPFYAYDLNFHDVVEARALEPDRKPSVLAVLERSGHQTLRIFFEADVSEEARLARLGSLAALQISYERCGARYFALDLEPGASMDAARDHLDEWRRDGVADYETCEARVPGSFDDRPAADDAE